MYKKGTVVLVPFPFTDLSGTKVRPALIISHTARNDDVTVVFITSHKQPRGAHTVQVAPTADNGLKTNSHIVCKKIATVEKKIILGELGVLETDTLQKVNAMLCRILELP
jgi:mRNA interferase MazF